MWNIWTITAWSMCGFLINSCRRWVTYMLTLPTFECFYFIAITCISCCFSPVDPRPWTFGVGLQHPKTSQSSSRYNVLLRWFPWLSCHTLIIDLIKAVDQRSITGHVWLCSGWPVWSGKTCQWDTGIKETPGPRMWPFFSENPCNLCGNLTWS